MATHSSILAWKIPWMEEPGWLQSMESDTTELLSTHTHMLLLLHIVIIIRLPHAACGILVP